MSSHPNRSLIVYYFSKNHHYVGVYINSVHKLIDDYKSTNDISIINYECDLEIDEQIADRCVEASIVMAKEVTTQREVEKEAEEARALEEEAAAAVVLDGKIDDDAEAAADSILGLDAPVEESTIENEAVIEDEEAVVVTDSEQTEQTDTTA